MDQNWVGYTVAVDCGDVLGKFRGSILKVHAKDQCITIGNAERNGEPFGTGVTIR